MFSETEKFSKILNSISIGESFGIKTIDDEKYKHRILVNKTSHSLYFRKLFSHIVEMVEFIHIYDLEKSPIDHSILMFNQEVSRNKRRGLKNLSRANYDMFVEHIKKDKKRIKNTRTHLYHAQKGCCALCERKIKKGEETLDHWIPKSKGGTNYIYNLLVMCKACNEDKGNKIYKMKQLKMPSILQNN